MRGRDHANCDASDGCACFDYTSPTDVQILAGPAELDGGEVVSGFHVPLHRLFEDEQDVSTTSLGAAENDVEQK
ncbi:MAG: hypothetical protein ACHRXM_00945 [Isosphaerales bacterium]